MKICIVGLGYIGLPTAAVFAQHGHQVYGVDKNPKVIEALREGRVIIEEPGLPELVRGMVASGALRCGELPEEADAFIISVPTPVTESKGADMRFVRSATESVVPYLRKGNLVILESTSPVGTVEELMRPILEQSGLKAGSDFYLGHSPERVIPGKILYELVHNDRIAGGIDEASAERIAALYGTFVQGQIFRTNARTAELCKLSENTFRDVNIAFANELARICESLDIDVWELISLCNKHPRVNIHQPGPGVGGHCIAVDPWFIAEKRPELAKIIRLCRETNDAMPAYTAERAAEILRDVPAPAKICVLGVTYKPDVDDMRESPILKIMDILKERGYEVSAYDPFVGGRPGIGSDLLEAAAGADLLLLGVHHQEFKALPFEALGKVMRRRNFFDTRNFADSAAAQAAGFGCWCLGR
jgi:UDP-N-acetyl-D-mannosaminuronic acid dehydrogenase